MKGRRVQGANSISEPQPCGSGVDTHSSPGPPGQPQDSCPVLRTSTPLPAQKRSQRLRKDPLSSVTGADLGLWGPSDTHPAPSVGGERGGAAGNSFSLSIQDDATHHVAGTQGEGALGGQAKVPAHQWPEEPGHSRRRGSVGEGGTFPGSPTFPQMESDNP